MSKVIRIILALAIGVGVGMFVYTGFNCEDFNMEKEIWVVPLLCIGFPTLGGVLAASFSCGLDDNGHPILSWITAILGSALAAAIGAFITFVAFFVYAIVSAILGSEFGVAVLIAIGIGAIMGSGYTTIYIKK